MHGIVIHTFTLLQWLSFEQFSRSIMVKFQHPGACGLIKIIWDHEIIEAFVEPLMVNVNQRHVASWLN